MISPSESFAAGFLADSVKRLEGYKQMADSAIGQLSDDQLFTIPARGSNSVAVIIRHMAGNMKSRWTNFMTEDGEKAWRNRDQEFETADKDRKSLLSEWESGWQCLLGTLKNLTVEDLTKEIKIRGEKHLAYDAILRQIMHYSSHVGQIIYASKWLKGAQWVSLTIAKNQSRAFNQSMGYST